jgi:putative hydrolase of the HAD superfamily
MCRTSFARESCSLTLDKGRHAHVPPRHRDVDGIADTFVVSAKSLVPWAGVPDDWRYQPMPEPGAKRTFDNTQIWIFDLDNTLYPADCNLFAQVDQKMAAFIADYLGVPLPYARHLQKSYYRKFGTTLAGLMHVHKMEPTRFLEYVHDIDLAAVPEHPELAQAIEALPGRKLIFTAGSRRHAENVAGKLGVLHLFEDIMDIVDTGFVPKEEAAAYDRFLRRHNVAPTDAAMFEDMPHNLLAAHALGMTTVLVHSSYVDHPIQLKIREWTEPPEHIHHMTEDLCGFLSGIAKKPSSS